MMIQYTLYCQNDNFGVKNDLSGAHHSFQSLKRLIQFNIHETLTNSLHSSVVRALVL